MLSSLNHRAALWSMQCSSLVVLMDFLYFTMKMWTFLVSG